MVVDILQWCHNERDSISNHRRLDCLLNGSFRRRSKETSKLHVAGLCEGNSPVTQRVILSITNYYITRKVCWGWILLRTNHLNASTCAVVPFLIECSGHGVIDNPITKWVWFHNTTFLAQQWNNVTEIFHLQCEPQTSKYSISIPNIYGLVWCNFVNIISPPTRFGQYQNYHNVIRYAYRN